MLLVLFSLNCFPLLSIYIDHVSWFFYLLNLSACILSLFQAGSSAIKNFLSLDSAVISSWQTKERLVCKFGVFGLVVGWVWFIYDLMLFWSLDLCGYKVCESLWAWAQLWSFSPKEPFVHSSKCLINNALRTHSFSMRGVVYLDRWWSEVVVARQRDKV